MLTDKDIQKLIQEFSIVFATKPEFESFKEEIFRKFDNLQSAVDGYKKKAETNKQEITMMGNRVTRNERNIATLAESTDTEIEH